MMKRKVKACLLALMLLSCMGLSANAVVAQPRAILCDCGGTMVVQRTQYGSWVTVGCRNCVHGLEGTDIRKTQKVTSYKKCNSCGRTLSDTVTKSKWECNGKVQ